MKTALKAHLTACLKAKKDKAQRKKEQKEARERERRAAENDGKDDDGDTNMGDDDEDEKGHSIKTAKKSAGKKLDLEKGKKRKLDADAEKGPKSKKKKEELKVKTTKPKGERCLFEIPSWPVLLLELGITRVLIQYMSYAQPLP